MGSAGGAGRGGGLRRLGGGAGKGSELQGCRVRAWGAAPGGRHEPPGAAAGPGQLAGGGWTWAAGGRLWGGWKTPTPVRLETLTLIGRQL
jgi:hypothetical protein